METGSPPNSVGSFGIQIGDTSLVCSFRRIPRGGIEQNQFDSLVELVVLSLSVPRLTDWNCENLERRDMSCPICDNAIESTDHLFFRRKYLLVSIRMDSKLKRFRRSGNTLVVTLIYRNKLLFDERKPSKSMLIDNVIASSFYWLLRRSGRFRGQRPLVHEEDSDDDFETPVSYQSKQETGNNDDIIGRMSNASHYQCSSEASTNVAFEEVRKFFNEKEKQKRKCISRDRICTQVVATVITIFQTGNINLDLEKDRDEIDKKQAEKSDFSKTESKSVDIDDITNLVWCLPRL
ncbi:hypothetical protein Tco_0940403 [Tanacetum coccineum]|uniref:Uncharacterized protein n=1 Tax=Tanacetum coccineum TaxID=301880 RepID=A0ABQ5DNT7_9ASTR